MTFGLRLTFSRETTNQFSLMGPPREHSSIDPQSPRRWHVLGFADFLRIDGIHSLADLKPIHPCENGERPLESRGRSELLLFQNPWNHPKTSEVVDDVLALAGTDGQYTTSPSHWRLMFLLRVTLSSIAIDNCRTFHGVERSLQVAERRLHDLVEAHDLRATATVWHTLGGPDLAVLVGATTPGEFVGMNSLLESVRTQPIGVIQNWTWRVPAADMPSSHAFAFAQGTLCFREPNALCNELVDQVPFKTAEEQAGIHYLCRLTPGTGHERSFAVEVGRCRGSKPAGQSPASPASVSPPSSETDITWGYRSVVARFGHLGEVIKAILQSTWTPEGKRRDDLSAVRTSIGSRIVHLANPTTGDAASSDATGVDPLSRHHHLTSHSFDWTLTADFANLLSELRDQHKSFANEFLGPMQAHELLQAFETWAVAFQRNERLGAIRDLLPFMRQLAACLSETDAWQTHLSAQPGTFEDWTDQFTTLIRHLWRSIRNRVELRGEPADPAFPNTLEYGASRLVNAYTVAAWLCWDLLLRGGTEATRATNDGTITNPPALPARGRAGNAKSHEQTCRAERFAACVAAGVAGRVECEESFGDLRAELEWDPDQTAIGSAHAERWAACRATTPPLPVRHLCTREEGKWNGYLLLLSISGETLFKPELAMVLCLHEMAEFARWVMLPRLETLRIVFNQWSYDLYAKDLGVLATECCHPSSALNDTPPTDLDPKVWARRALKHVFTSLTTAPHASANTQSPDQPLDESESPFASDPIAFPGWLQRAFVEQLPQSFRSINDTLFGVMSPAPLSGWNNFPTQVRAGTTRGGDGSPIANRQYLLTESIPDLAMCLGLMGLLQSNHSQRSGERALPTIDFLNDIERIYTEIIGSTSEWQRPSGGLAKALGFLITRWAFVDAVVSGLESPLHHGDDKLAETWLTRFVGRLDRIRKDPSHPAQSPVVLGVDSLGHAGPNYPRPGGYFSTKPEFYPIPKNSPENSLAFRVAQWYSTQEGNKIVGLPKPRSAEDRLLRMFVRVWRLEQTEPGADLNRHRIRLAFAYWAKAQRFSFEQVLGRVHTTGDLGSEPVGGA